MIQVAYSNSVCKDLWPAFYKLLMIHSKMQTYSILDIEAPYYIDKHFIYAGDAPYYKAWTDALKALPNEFFIYLQEDFFLYDRVDMVKIREYETYLKEHPEYSFVRLLKSGALGNKKITDTLYEIESTNQDIFSMQATIWRSSDYIKLLEEVKDEKWLENYKYRDAAIKLGIKGLYHYDGEPKRGGAHYDSKVYPYIATALVRGKWNLSEYPKELGKIGQDHNIDFTKRGTY